MLVKFLAYCRLVFSLSFILLAGIAFSSGMGDEDCLACHGDPALVKELEGKKISVHIDEKLFKGSVHGSFGCVDCHGDVKDYPHDPAPKRVSCADCHSDTQEAYNKGMHSKGIKEEHLKAASCLDCHGNAHQILSSHDPRAKTYRATLPQTCGACHKEKFVMEGSGISGQPFYSYTESVHGKAVGKGELEAATCIDCHESHNIRSGADPESPIFKFNVPRTCSRCHKAIEEEFNQSIHGKAIHRGNWQSPVCTDCHGIHFIKARIDPTSSVADQALARTTCVQCHEGMRLSQEFGVPGARGRTYLDSYHGLASQLGSKIAANCASCHGVHNILPSSEPQSMTHKDNLIVTCGKCHPGASQNFAKGKIHVEVGISKDIGGILMRWVRKIYIWLIILTIGSMLVHNALIWWKKARPHLHSPDRTILRMDFNQRIQHVTLIISFFVLVVTGFALKYPETWFALVLGNNEWFRRLAHRVAAVFLMGAGFYHIGYILFSKEGWRTFKEFMPMKKDLTDFIHNMLYYLGLRSTKPEFARFGYIEKAEYWALVWGIIVMGVTGFLAWFESFTTQFAPRWVIDVAIAIHFYEAILATLAIIVWHFYHVIFDPDVYPVNFAFWDGKVSRNWYEEEHYLHYKEIEASEKNAKK